MGWLQRGRAQDQVPGEDKGADAKLVSSHVPEWCHQATWRYHDHDTDTWGGGEPWVTVKCFRCCWRLPPAVQDAVGARGDALKQRVQDFNEKYRHLLHPGSSTAASGSGPRPQSQLTRTVRTESKPVYVTPSAPPNLARQMCPSQKLTEHEFDTQFTWLVFWNKSKND